ncbi:uncharacterized protein DS421_5g157820 [Arachis hypogaea]|nr:uncharacterized protein DS421_5g157820 [Arachis hypogaea]
MDFGGNITNTHMEGKCKIATYVFGLLFVLAVVRNKQKSSSLIDRKGIIFFPFFLAPLWQFQFEDTGSLCAFSFACLLCRQTLFNNYMPTYVRFCVQLLVLELNSIVSQFL